VNYSWHITKLGLTDKLNRDDVLLENAIVRVQWKRLAEDADGITASYLGSTDLDPSNISAVDFTALNNVTKDMVVNWIEKDLTDKGIDKVNTKLDAKIARNRLNTIKPNWK